jgi:hypothetical protein
MYIAGEKHLYPLMGWLIQYWRGRLGACCIVAQAYLQDAIACVQLRDTSSISLTINMFLVFR